jgi:phosphoribosyl 1,2-cyclic phosphate phosphodiesterase
LKVTFLGTGTSQGVPIIACKCEVCKSVDQRDKRLRSSILFDIEGKAILVDCGPDFREQMLIHKVDRLDAILFTHEHRDHVAGLDDVRAFNYILQRPMDIYAEERVIKMLQVEFAYAFEEEKYPGVPDLIVHQITNEEFEVEGIKIIPIRAMHASLPVLGFRFGDFTYITDANFISKEEKKKMKGTKYLVVNALRKMVHPSHFNLSDALALIAEIKPDKAYLTHVSHQMGLYEDIQKELPSNVMFAYDGLKLEV